MANERADRVKIGKVSKRVKAKVCQNEAMAEASVTISQAKSKKPEEIRIDRL